MNKTNGEIGYAKPPAANRFQKGASGNPSGRPKKVARFTSDQSASTRLNDLILAEAYRPVKITEDGRTVEMPLIQAVVRGLGYNAAKGNMKAQMAIAGLTQKAQAGQQDDKRAVFEAVVEYKTGWEETVRICDMRGDPYPNAVPHPDDLAYDTRTGEVFYNGPLDPAEKANWDKLTALRKQSQEDVDRIARRLKRSPADRTDLEQAAATAQATIDRIDRIIPDEETRRVPGFRIAEWRERQAAVVRK